MSEILLLMPVTQMGAYPEEQILPVEKAVPVPTSIDPVTTASIVHKGLTCQLLLRQCFKVKPRSHRTSSCSSRWSWIIVLPVGKCARCNSHWNCLN